MGVGVVGWVQGYKIQSSELGWNSNSKYANLFAQVSDIGPSWSACFTSDWSNVFVIIPQINDSPPPTHTHLPPPPTPPTPRSGGGHNMCLVRILLALALVLASMCHFIVCKISLETVDGFLSNVQWYIIGKCLRAVQIWMTLTLLSRSQYSKYCQIFIKKQLVCILNRWIDLGQACSVTALQQLKELVRFWWPWPHFQDQHLT